jgi:hypothetical protein
MRASVVGALVVCSALVPGVGGAQAVPVGLGVTGLVAVPAGPLARLRNTNVGVSALARYQVPALPWLAVRAEIAALPSTSQVVPSGPCPCSSVSMTTGSSVVLAGIGPEFSMRVGGVRAYTTATAGVARVWATSVLAQGFTPAGGLPFSRSTGSQATNFAWSGGGGIAVPLSSGRTATTLDLGLRYYDVGAAAYKIPRYIAPSGGGSPFTTVRHGTTFVAPSVGVVLRP